MSQENELIEVQDITRDTKTFKNKINYGDFYTPPPRNGFPRDVNSPTTYLRTYDRLLRDGRYHLTFLLWLFIIVNVKSDALSISLLTKRLTCQEVVVIC